MAMSKKQLFVAKVTKKNIWVAQPAEDMGRLWKISLESILGTMTSVYTVSELANMPRKKVHGSVEVMVHERDRHDNGISSQS